MRKRAKLTPHQKIMRAGIRGTGLRLSALEVTALSLDDAIAQCADNDDFEMKQRLTRREAGGKGGK